MRCVIHYTPQVVESTTLATRCLQSVKQHPGWHPELRPGFTAADVNPDDYRLYGFLSSYQGEKLRTKLACFCNHLRFWQQVTDHDEPAVFLEHDVICLASPSDWPHDFVHLCWDTGQHHTYRNTGITIAKTYVKNNQYQGSTTMAGMGGTAAYYVTPSGAAQLLEAYHTHGAEQSDLFINSHNIHIHIQQPSVFELDLTSISTSHGLTLTQ